MNTTDARWRIRFGARYELFCSGILLASSASFNEVLTTYKHISGGQG